MENFLKLRVSVLLTLERLEFKEMYTFASQREKCNKVGNFIVNVNIINTLNPIEEPHFGGI